jgi:hypothetical protein
MGKKKKKRWALESTVDKAIWKTFEKQSAALGGDAPSVSNAESGWMVCQGSR